MLSTYNRKPGSRTYSDYHETKVDKAVQAVAKGMSLRQAAEQYGVPKSTIANKRLGAHKKRPGRLITF